jgi:hypothetical protein
MSCIFLAGLSGYLGQQVSLLVEFKVYSCISHVSECLLFFFPLNNKSFSYTERKVLCDLCAIWGSRGSVLVKALCYKPEGWGFDTRWDEFLNLSNPFGRTRPWGPLNSNVCYSYFFNVLHFISITYPLHVSAPTGHLHVDYIISYILRSCLTTTDLLFLFIFGLMFLAIFRRCQPVCGGYVNLLSQYIDWIFFNLILKLIKIHLIVVTYCVTIFFY